MQAVDHLAGQVDLVFLASGQPDRVEGLSIAQSAFAAERDDRDHDHRMDNILAAQGHHWDKEIS